MPITGAGKAMKAWKDTAKAIEENNKLLVQILAELKAMNAAAAKEKQP